MKTQVILSNDGKRLNEALAKLTNLSVKVGWFEKSQYPNHTPVAAVAASNEFGNPKHKVPARPFMRPTVANKQTEWTKILEDGAKKVLENRLTIHDVLDHFGAEVVRDIKIAIRKVYYPALAESTVLNRIRKNAKLSKIKGQISESNLGLITKPLMDTKIMFNTLTHEIE